MKEKKALVTSGRSLAAKHPIAAGGVTLLLATGGYGLYGVLRAIPAPKPRTPIPIHEVLPIPQPGPKNPTTSPEVLEEIRKAVLKVVGDPVEAWLRQEVLRIAGDPAASTTPVEIHIRAETKAQVREGLDAIRREQEGGPLGKGRGKLKSIDYTAGEIVFTDKNGVDHKLSLKSLLISAAGGAGLEILISSGSEEEEDPNESVPPEEPVFSSQQEFERFVVDSLEKSLLSTDWMNSEAHETTIVIVLHPHPKYLPSPRLP